MIQSFISFTLNMFKSVLSFDLFASILGAFVLTAISFYALHKLLG